MNYLVFSSGLSSRAGIQGNRALLLSILLFLAAALTITACSSDSEAEADKGPFDHPDGVYLGESDLED